MTYTYKVTAPPSLYSVPKIPNLPERTEAYLSDSYGTATLPRCRTKSNGTRLNWVSQQKHPYQSRPVFLFHTVPLTRIVTRSESPVTAGVSLHSQRILTGRFYYSTIKSWQLCKAHCSTTIFHTRMTLEPAWSSLKDRVSISDQSANVSEFTLTINSSTFK